MHHLIKLRRKCLTRIDNNFKKAHCKRKNDENIQDTMSYHKMHEETRKRYRDKGIEIKKDTEKTIILKSVKRVQITYLI